MQGRAKKIKQLKVEEKLLIFLLKDQLGALKGQCDTYVLFMKPFKYFCIYT